jgi:hypothetical protein
MEFTGLGTIMPRFQYKETTIYDVDQLKKMANKTIFNSISWGTNRSGKKEKRFWAKVA